MLDLKNEQIALLERQNKQLSQFGGSPEGMRDIQKSMDTLRRQLAPLVAVTNVDPLLGRASFGGMNSPTQLSEEMAAAVKLVEQQKYDLALRKADEIRSKHPDFAGADYISFLVNQKKAYGAEMVRYGLAVIQKLPSDKRIADVYVAVINQYLKDGRKLEAEGMAMQALELWPGDQQLIDSFKNVFGYLPSNAGTQNPAGK